MKKSVLSAVLLALSLPIPALSSFFNPYFPDKERKEEAVVGYAWTNGPYRVGELDFIYVEGLSKDLHGTLAEFWYTEDYHFSMTVNFFGTCYFFYVMEIDGEMMNVYTGHRGWISPPIPGHLAPIWWIIDE